MNQIAISDVKRWNKHGSYYIPLGADYLCPNPSCSKLTHHHRDSEGTLDNLNGVSVTTKMVCSRCGGVSVLWSIGLATDKKTVQAIYLSPPAKSLSSNVDLSEFENGVVPSRVLKTYRDALASYEAGIWDAAGTLCGKALEGAVKSKLPDDKKTTKGLGAQLKELEKDTSLTNPFSRVTDAIRVGRNVSAHFDDTIEIDEATAKALIDLVEYVLEFLFVYEAKAKTLSRQIAALKQVSHLDEGDSEVVAPS